MIVMKHIVKVVGLLGIIALVGFGCNRATKPVSDKQKQVIDRSAILLDARNQGLIMDTGEIEHMKDSSVLVADEKKEVAPDWSTFAGLDYKGWQAAALADVTGGTSYGLVHIGFLNGKSQITATFGDLPQLTDGSVYEAWLVKRGDGMKVMDLGALTPATEKLFTFTYASKTELKEFDFFVVTLQAPNAKAPGEHLLEGMIR